MFTVEHALDMGRGGRVLGRWCLPDGVVVARSFRQVRLRGGGSGWRGSGRGCRRKRDPRFREIHVVILLGSDFGAADGAVASELYDLLVCAPDMSVASEGPSSGYGSGYVRERNKIEE